MIKGIDISAYQKGFTKVPAGAEFVIIKATEGRTWTSRELVTQITTARAAGKQVAWYHWLHRDNADAQVTHFLGTVQPHLQRGDAFVIDWEKQKKGVPNPTEANKDDAIRLVQQQKPRHRTLLYCNASWWRSSNKFCGDGLMVAHYGVEPGQPKINEDWLIHQYTAPDFDDTVDYDWNVARFDSLRAMQAWALGKEPVPAAPFKIGQRLRVNVATSLHARSGPGLGEDTETGRYVTPGYLVDVEAREWSPVDRTWFFRGATFWYGAGEDGTYLQRVPPTEYLVDINPGSTLNARSGPSTSGTKVLAQRARGFVVHAERTVQDTSGAKGDDGRPRRWAVTETGEHYALEYLQKAS